MNKISATLDTPLYTPSYANKIATQYRALRNTHTLLQESKRPHLQETGRMGKNCSLIPNNDHSNVKSEV